MRDNFEIPHPSDRISETEERNKEAKTRIDADEVAAQRIKQRELEDVEKGSEKENENLPDDKEDENTLPTRRLSPDEVADMRRSDAEELKKRRAKIADL